MRIYYFGCVKICGHHMYRPENDPPKSLEERRELSDFVRTNPWGFNIDNGFKGLQHKDGWTAYAMVDNTVDSRPGSNSVFIAEGTFTEQEMKALAREHFPVISRRIWGGLAKV